MKEKIALFCDVDTEGVIDAVDTDCVYEVPITFEREGFARQVLNRLGLQDAPAELADWEEMIERLRSPQHEVTIAVVGKYTQNGDAYISVAEAMRHGGIHNQCKVDIRWLEATDIQDDNVEVALGDAHGIIVTGAFGSRGIEGKIRAIRYARERGIPYLGLCLGLQLSVVEFARNVCSLRDANSTEFDEELRYPTPHPVIHLMPSQETVRWKGATMRLGAHPCRLQEDSLAYRLYREATISERHRHRYEVNNEYRQILAEHGMKFSGTSPDDVLVEIIELPAHPFFIASQFHPEFRSRPNRAHPLFAGLVEAAIIHAEGPPTDASVLSAGR
jgi:CTP synthase